MVLVAVVVIIHGCEASFVFFRRDSVCELVEHRDTPRQGGPRLVCVAFRATVIAAILEGNFGGPVHVLVGAPVAENAHGGTGDLVEGRPWAYRSAEGR